jgi:nucleoside-diphosphate-sugar epimerase
VKRILVTGGTGVLGREVVGRLVERRDEVCVLTRDPRAVVPDRARTVIGDLAAGEGLLEAIVDADVVLHLATNPWRASRVDQRILENSS